MASSGLARRLLLAGLVGANLLTIGLSIRFLVQSHQHYEGGAEVASRNVAHALDESISSSISRVDLALAAVVDELERQLATRKRIDEAVMLDILARYEQRLPEVEAFRVCDDQGSVILGKGLNKSEHPNWSDRDYFSYLRAHPDAGLQVSEPRMGRVAKRPIVGFARRYNFPDGRFAGVVSAPIAVDHFDKLLRRYDVGANGTLILRYINLGLITRVPAIPDQAVGQVGNTTVSKELRQKAESGLTSATYHLENSPDGFERILTFHRLAQAPMFAIVGMASKDYLADWYREVYKTAALVSGFLMLSLVAWAGLRYLLLLAEGREQQLRTSSRELARLAHSHSVLLQSMGEGIYGVDLEGNTSFINPTALSLLGVTEADVLGKSPHEIFHYHRADGTAYPQEECPVIRTLRDGQIRHHEDEWFWRQDGSRFPVSMTVTPVMEHDRRVGAVVVFQDISQRKAYETKINELAFYDYLTRLPNRRLLFDRLHLALPASARRDAYGALMFLDLDNFKTLNDSMGHEYGDLLLVEVAHRLLSSVRAEDTVARLGGDEFVVMLEGLGPEEMGAQLHAVTVAEKICHQLGLNYTLRDREFKCSCSIGVVLFKGAEVDANELVRRADKAMYQAKTAGRNTVFVFDHW